LKRVEWWNQGRHLLLRREGCQRRVDWKQDQVLQAEDNRSRSCLWGVPKY